MRSMIVLAGLLFSACLPKQIEVSLPVQTEPSGGFAVIYAAAYCGEGKSTMDIQLETDAGWKATIHNLCAGRQTMRQVYKCLVPAGLEQPKEGRTLLITRAKMGSYDGYRDFHTRDFHTWAGDEVAFMYGMDTYGEGILMPRTAHYMTEDLWSPEVMNFSWPGEGPFGVPDQTGSWSDNPNCQY